MPRPSSGGDRRVREERGVRQGPNFVEEYVLREGQGFRELEVSAREHGGTGAATGPGPSPQQMIEAVLFGHLPPGVRRAEPGPSNAKGSSR